jgi:uncharacterized protein YjbI with pentapeptide repeats
MANQEHLKILKSGVEFWNRWKRIEFHLRTDLRNAELYHADLTRAYLPHTDFSCSKLNGAILNGAILQSAVLQGADLRAADLRSADLSYANLRGADLRGAELRQANLDDDDLRGAKLNGAILGRTILGDLDLRNVEGLAEVKHAGPSIVGVDTIYRSHGKIPESFLRGCGVPDTFITYARSLIGAALEFYSLFISYSTRDQPFADRLHADLQAKGIRCWFAPHDIQGGRKIHEQIDEAIKLYDKLLLILSDHSMNSNWVKTEIANARAKETQQARQVLFPITLVPFEQIKAWKLFDADTGIDSAREIREYFIPDFSEWKDHDCYQRDFERLVRDLKAPADPKSSASSTA